MDSGCLRVAASEIDQHAATKMETHDKFQLFPRGVGFNCMNGKMLIFFLLSIKESPSVQDPPIAYGLSFLAPRSAHNVDAMCEFYGSIMQEDQPTTDYGVIFANYRNIFPSPYRIPSNRGVNRVFVDSNRFDRRGTEVGELKS